MPLSDLEMASTRRTPYGTRTAAGMSNTRTKIGVSAALEPEKKVTLHHGCCSSRQTVLMAMSLTHAAKSAEKVRIRYRSRVVGADNAVSSGGTSVKRRKNGMARSSQNVYELDRKAIGWRSRTGVVHEMRTLGGAEMSTCTPEPTDMPKRINWCRLTP